MRGKVTNIIPRMYGKSDFFTYFSVSPHSFIQAQPDPFYPIRLCFG